MLEFLRVRGVVLPWSLDLRMIGRVDSKGKLCGVVAYNGFVGATCCIHCAGDDSNWASPEFLYASFDYPFNKCKLVAVFGTLASNNLQALRLDQHLGFRQVHIVPQGWDSENDLIILEMRRENCRWLKEDSDGEQQISRGVAVGSSA